MELESTNSGPTAKLPILKLGEYKMWVIRIKQYFQIQDYALWEVIENGDSLVSIPQTTQENARGLLLMALPSEHQLTFSQYPDAKSMFAAIETRFGGLREIHEDDLVSNGFEVAALFAKWSVTTFISWDTLPGSVEHQEARKVYTDKTSQKHCVFSEHYETLKKQCDNLIVKLNQTEFIAATYNRGLAIVEAQLITYRKNKVLFSEEVAVLKREVACKDYEINVLKSEFEKVKQEKDGIDFKIEKFDKASKDLDQLLGSQITDKSKKGLGYSAVTPPHPLIYNRPNKLDLSYYGLDEFKEPEFKGYGPENSKMESNVVCDKESENSKENSDESLVEEQVSQDKSSFVESSPNVDKETVFPANKKVEFTKPENHENPVKKLVRYAEMYKSQSPRGNQRNWNRQKSNQLGKYFVMYNKACYICGSFNHLQINCHNHQRRGIISRNNYNRVDAKNTHPNVLRNMSPKAVLLKTGLTQLNIVRQVNTAHPKTTVHSAKSKTHFLKQVQSTAKRPFYKQTTLTRRYVHEAKRHYYTRRHNAVNTAWSYTGQVNVVRVKGGKPQHDDKGLVDSGCSRHMTGNIAYLLDFKEFDGCYVAFRGGAYGGRITGKGTLKTDNLDFKDVYFVNEFKFNLFSVSQMCDKKNYVLFTDTECLVLSPNFKLPEENQILLKIPRKDNMYSFDMKNIVPKESLTCLVAKATLDESMLWHRRLGHINFKNINKLVKGNLVRGLPTKHFENDQTYVACLKGKQHRASSERRNRTLIEAARTMLADSKLPTTFWAEAVSTACYVQNLGLSKFDDKSDKGFFVGYSLSSKAFRVITTKLEYQEVTSSTVSNDSAGTSEENSQDCIVEDGPNNENVEQERFADDSSTKDVNVVGQHINTASPYVNTGSLKLNVVGPSVNTASPNEQDNTEEKPEFDLGNITNSYIVPTTPNTRIHKDHPIDNVIGELKSTVQTKRMSKPTSKQGFLIWILGDLPIWVKKAIRTKWVFRNKKDERGIVIRTQAEVTIEDDGIIYLSMIGSLMYLTASRLDIMFVVCACARFQVTPKPSHLLAIKRIFRYLKGKPTLGLWYSRDSPFELVAYIDSDYARATQDRKSTT
ncbi:ribonuclease H-like domain-containing protein [Tanacetum coccineum]